MEDALPLRAKQFRDRGALNKSPVWICNPRTPKCRNGHPFITFRESPNKSTFEWRGDMHLYLTCGTCGLHAFGVLHARPSPLLHFYAVDRKQLDLIKALDDDTQSLEILEILGYYSPEHAA